MKRIKKKSIIFLLVLIFISAFVYKECNGKQDVNKKVLEEVTQMDEKEPRKEKQKEEKEEVRIEGSEAPKKAYKESEILELKRINSDTVGILDIPNTRIYYPVLQTSDNELYLKQNIHKEYDIHGSIYMDYENDYLASDNIILYGHNMLDGTMFSDLDQYKDLKFMEDNRDIYFYVDDKIEHYQVIGSMILNLDTEDEIFSFNSHIDFDEGYGAKEYFQDIKSETNNLLVEEVEEDAKFLTLSTCSYETDDARFVLFATKVGGGLVD